ncbi:MFS transporter [Micromonospora sp. WMMD558]|uniref:MFS transporter n=1 Tax=Micromonospora sp. WMMD558 TaxID=3403462 RepID=UPI003BF53FEF
MPETRDRSAPRSASLAKIVTVSSAGSAIEWYDFFIYGTAAALVFNKLFFPQTDPLVGTLLAFTTFAVGFVARPLGGALFGHLGDKLGRKPALVTALLLMGGSTTLIGLLPTYGTIGVAAPIVLVVLRFLQGIAVGGQWGGAVLIATENAPPNRRGFYGSFPQLGVPIGLVLSSLVYLVIMARISEQDFSAWGWRVPFLFSILLFGVALYAHRKLEETAGGKESRQDRGSSRSPVYDVLRYHSKNVALAAGAVIALGVGLYLFVTYMLSYGTTVLQLPKNTVLGGVLAGAILQVPAMLGFALLSDRIGRRRVLLLGAFGMGLWAFPAFLLVNTGQTPLVWLSLIVGQLLCAAMYGPQAAFFSELFSARVRYSGASLGYQIGLLFGGALTPLVATWLYAEAGSFVPVAILVVAAATISCCCVLVLTETNRRDRAVATVPQPAEQEASLSAS